jgi:hypothetical protein
MAASVAGTMQYRSRRKMRRQRMMGRLIAYLDAPGMRRGGADVKIDKLGRSKPNQSGGPDPQ